MIAARPVSKIYLVGFMGVGKTTLGRLLADRLGWIFVDLDAEIEAAEGTSIVRIFEEKGEPYFRAIERRVLAEVSARAGTLVVACGGGAFCTTENQTVMHAHGVTVWLDRPFERIWQHREELGSVRPLLASQQSRQSNSEAAAWSLGEAPPRPPLDADSRPTPRTTPQAPARPTEEERVRALCEERIHWYQAATIHLPIGEGEFAQALDRLLSTLAWHISAP